MVQQGHKKGRKAMRKICFTLFVLSVILLMVSHSFAQGPRGATSSEGKTGFTNIAVTGLADDGTDGFVDTGVPGYIEMTSTKGDIFYLFIDYDGVLRLASELAVGYNASPSIVGWTDSSGIVVGLQSE